MTERVLFFGLAVTAAHLALEMGTLAMGGTLVLADFDRGPTPGGTAGKALIRAHQALAWPLTPLRRDGPAWSWGRGYGGLLLNSITWGLCGALCSSVALRKARRAA